MISTDFLSLRAIRSIYSSCHRQSRQGIEIEPGVSVSVVTQTANYSEKTQILDDMVKRYFVHGTETRALKELVSDINKVLKNPETVHHDLGYLKKLFGNRGYFFQISSCPTSFSLVIICSLLRICGPKILISDSRFTPIYLKIAMRLFFNLSKDQRRYVEACIDRLKIIYTDFSVESVQLVLDFYNVDVTPQLLDVKDIDELFQAANAYGELRHGLFRSFANRDMVSKFLVDLIEGQETYIQYFFNLDQSMYERLQKHKKSSSLDMVKELSACTEEGKSVYSKQLNVFSDNPNDLVEMRTEIVFAGLSNPSRVNDLDMSIDQIQESLLYLNRSLLSPVSNFRVQFFYQKEIFEMFTSGAIFKGKLGKGGLNSEDQIQKLLFGRAYETIRTLFPQIVIQDVDSDSAIGTIIDLRLLTYFLPGEMTIFDSHVAAMKKTADENRINYFAVNCDAHSTLNRCQGMNIRRNHGSEKFHFLEGLKDFITMQMNQIRLMGAHDFKMDVLFRKWHTLCDMQNLKHERNTIPFVTLTLILVKYINSITNQNKPEIKITIGCKSAKDRTFAVIPGVEILLYLIKNRMQETSCEAFDYEFNNLFSKGSKGGYLNYPSLSPHEEELMSKLFDPRMFYVSSDYSEGVSTNINAGVFSDSFFRKVPELWNAHVQTVSLWDIKS